MLECQYIINYEFNKTCDAKSTLGNTTLITFVAKYICKNFCKLLPLC